MASSIAHRGPDDSGVWTDDSAGIAIGHRRLSILDLSPAGHQPMLSPSGRFVIAFNGEIYNHEALRRKLSESSDAQLQWRGHSDTETLLACIEHWGLEQTLAQCIGMFAIALWDRRERQLWLARDRFGEKPLYYGWVGGVFVFGSELKALRAFTNFDNPVSRGALVQYLRFLYVPAPRSIYADIFKLEPGCLLMIHNAAPATAPSEPLRPPSAYGSLKLRRWWSLSTVVEEGAAEVFTDENEALAALDEALTQAVKRQLLADVPLGAFLSGGVDSSLIAALMQEQSARPVKTFTVGFEETAFDESPHARAVAEHLGTGHEELFVSAAEARAVICELPSMYDEPFADSSQIPTHLVCRAARQQVTVALSGDAGDELFGGYNRYFWAPWIWKRLSWLPYPVRRALSAAVAAVPEGGWNAAGGMLKQLRPGTQGVARLGSKAHKLASRMDGVRSIDDLYLNLVSAWQAPASLVTGRQGTQIEPPSLLADSLPESGVEDCRLRMMFRDSMTYLPDDILCKVDRAAMAISLETRVPFLDHRVAQLAWRLPIEMKIRGNEGKWALRKLLYRRVPRELIERPKAGFEMPVGQWLRGPLREWAEGLLDASRLTQQGYLNPGAIRDLWQQHLSGRYDWTPRLWSILMFQAWLEEGA